MQKTRAEIPALFDFCELVGYYVYLRIFDLPANDKAHERHRRRASAEKASLCSAMLECLFSFLRTTQSANALEAGLLLSLSLI